MRSSTWSMAGAVVLALFQNCYGQSDKSLRFEVAAIKPAMHSLPASFSGGPGTSDPGRITYTRISLRSLISTAYYPLEGDRISGSKWIDSEYTVTAIIPPDTTRQQFRQMLANLLTERFHLAFHNVYKETVGYELKVAAEGTKLKSSFKEDLPPVSDASNAKRRVDENGFPILTSDSKWQGMADERGVYRATFRRSSMSDLADMLSLEFSRNRIPVVDNTGVAGAFDFHLALPAPPPPARVVSEEGGGGGVSAASDPDMANMGVISSTLEKQLGLKLSPIKTKQISMLIDHVDPVPAEN